VLKVQIKTEHKQEHDDGWVYQMLYNRPVPMSWIIWDVSLFSMTWQWGPTTLPIGTQVNFFGCEK
jgi:hypothetical protein